MKRIIVITVAATLTLAPLTVTAQEAGEAEGRSLMERGAELFLEGLMDEMAPALQEFQKLAEEMGPAFLDFAEQMGPALRDLMQKVEDWSAYHPPEILPNGDIIIRRKTPAEMDAPQGEIEL